MKQVNWKAPALNTVLLRYSREEVRYILTYGRPFSPMPAWGVKGGGPLNDQQLQNLIDYLEIDPAHARGVAEAASPSKLAEMRKEKNAGRHAQVPEVDQRRRGSVQPGLRRRLRRRRLLLRPLPHHRLVVRRQDGRRERRASARPLRGGSTLARFPGAILGQTNQTDFVCSGLRAGQALRPQRPGHRPHARLLLGARPRSTTRSTPVRSAWTPARPATPTRSAA